ncbi:LLM class flavin-dependent oxidoreductase [Pseudonocardia oroxyli]|uniref:Flavin-dependent oxidoreductase, luciferase family (Includes alkanesulfonate monooxygenase SsuD and methylene tetrahydromethanopterin reductase) n=1 Tax=Pseudonocardia oroxyli TaxID=366584 RepID=A0A1G8E814_PSEOR|nr:LLM class flavin-dependent oxidoreductase [Pseudonocardia oroxyli]SDH66023.1 Flavin-dependent oxidoreductase, luciferase family (includes alkanesulfonate monooxygenase SsuD and methylene tetrahydromethanopterin reductase) [Pseudonocardia oroxyli]
MAATDYARPDARLHLAGFFPFGPAYVWSEAERQDVYYDFASWRRLAQTAERGLFSTLFLGDSQRLREHLGRITDHSVTGRPDQLVLFAHLAAVTERIGLVATLNTTFNDPVDLARRLASVDVLSGGRAGWNIVTTDNDWTGENFRRGGEVGHAERYRHAEEHLATVQELWAGWSRDGSREIVRGARRAWPSVPPSPQGQPVLFQAGESPEGRDFAARHAEGIFSRYLQFDAALEFAGDMRRRLVRAGRPEDDLRIFPATRITLGATESEARDKARWFRDRTWSDRRVRAVVEAVWGHDLADHPVDGPLPAHDPVVATQTLTNGVVNTSDRPLRTAAAWRTLAEDRGLTMRQLVLHLNETVEFVGTPSGVADELAHYVRSGAIDGLNLVPNAVPGGYDEVVEHLVPALQDRGIYRTAYEGVTLRENLGLRPAVTHRRAAV